MSRKGGKRSFPLHKVLGPYMAAVTGEYYTDEQRLGAWRFITDLITGIENPKIKPVTLPGYHAGILGDYERLAIAAGKGHDERTLAALNELERQKKAAKAKRAKDKKAPSTIAVRGGD